MMNNVNDINLLYDCKTNEEYIKKVFKISQNDRNVGYKERSLNESINLIYGEIDLISLIEVIHDLLDNKLFNSCYINNDQTREFWDLGSGSGRVVIAMAMAFPEKFSKFIGIELLKELNNLALNALDKFNNNIVNKNQNKIIFEENDILSSKLLEFKSIQSPPIVYICSTAFSSDLMKKLATQCEYLPSGTIVITISNKLPSHLYKIQYQSKINATWGNNSATLYIQERTTNRRIESVILKNFYHRH